MTGEPISSEKASSDTDTKRHAAELIADGQGLVRSLALNVHRSLPVPTDLDDLIAYGQLGLVEAAQAYDPDAGARFTTFAFYRIRGAIYDGVAKMTWTSRARFRRLRFQAMADAVLENEHEDPNSSSSAAQDANWLSRVTEQLAVVFLVTSEEDSVGNSLTNAVDPYDSPGKTVASREMQQSLRKLVDQLPSDARRLVSSIYFEGFTLTQAAERAGISKSWASRLHAKSLNQLAKSLRKMGAD
ncbi:RNA polymerase sigma factor FliA [Novipirellula aureliae]|uniref:RNA polymerase sigma factor FliA n=1 Tax=Novipirellula aureliae TaxID=2527966 RepID=A0A5C6E9I9_9BACT|nr:sigma-70 family RNA polymerase sigma factor [Novipirellula aureliae]TWU45185.1 RNA polymerase sigma factor FliA [Novipirellula aureliae]